MSNKPARILGQIVFKGSGGVRKEIELLPLDKTAHEISVATKFVRALRRTGRILNDPEPATEPCDCESVEGDQRVFMQLVEAVIPREARRQSILQQYRVAVADLLQPAISEFLGLHITMSFRERSMPSAFTREGRALVASFANAILNARPAISHCKLGQWLVLRVPGSTAAHSLSVVRVAPMEFGIPPELQTDGSLQFDRDEADEVLANAICQKVRKGYEAPRNGRFLLVVYQLMGILSAEKYDPRPYEIARQILNDDVHPFDEVWYFSPMAGDAHGIVAPVWPCTLRAEGGLIAHASAPKVILA